MAAHNFLTAGDHGVVDELYRKFLEDPHSVPKDTARAFASLLAEYVPSNGASELAWRADGHLLASTHPLGRDIPASATLEKDHALSAVYGGAIGWEFMHLQEGARKDWLVEQVESAGIKPTSADQNWMLGLLTQAEMFEHGLQRRFPSEKRFGLEGAESFLVLSEVLLREAVISGARNVVIGGMHRGRLNILAHLMDKPLTSLIAEVIGKSPFPEGMRLAADVAYHNGYSSDRMIAGHSVHLSLLPHPSHLSVIAPVALGKSRAVQDLLGAKGRALVLPLVMHTDAAFSGQGIVAETLQLSRLEPFSSGGAIHMVLDNHLGFTTLPHEARSGQYCTDIARAFDVPVVHVNAEEPDAVFKAAVVTARYWAQFHDSIVVVLHAYRRRGHNELDEPRFTQPLMYQAIDSRDSVVEIYAGKLRDSGADISENAVLASACAEKLNEAAVQASKYSSNQVNYFQGHWSGFHIGHQKEMTAFRETGAPIETLRSLGRKLTTVPDAFTLDEKIERFIADRRQSLETGEGINWGTAEALALASLAHDGFSVRFGGQDTPRGAFAQRHLVLHDQITGKTHLPLGTGGLGRSRVDVFNTPLAEYSVLAFEYGYSLAAPQTLVCWEAQFGDFLNIAQPVMDQFISCGESRWLRSSGLVLLLPHGLDGGGPDHSTAHPERLLNACADDNMQIVNASTPAQYFHVLRRQMLRSFRKPLVVLTPKALLRQRDCKSSLEEFGPGTGFRNVLAENKPDSKRLILCSGKIYFELAAERASRGLENAIALARVEQLYPLDHAVLRKLFTVHDASEFIWCQEEPLNMGPFCALDRELSSIAGRPLRYAGRSASASPAVGVHEWHVKERQALLDAALDGL